MTTDTPEPWKEEKREGYYVSITDMLIGLLFLFILMLMYFALQLRVATQDLVTAEETRNQLLEKIATYLREYNVRAEVDYRAGVLRLPDEILFEKAQDQPKQAGVAALSVLANAMTTHLPCYAFEAKPRPADKCGDVAHHLEAIFIEGHTDSDRVTPTPRIRDNWDLSSARASNTWRALVMDQPGLAGFKSGPADDPDARPIFSIAGYADQRPATAGSDELAKATNRRIDLRFVMAAPNVAGEAARLSPS
jgi:chemotaxis protein MotB